MESFFAQFDIYAMLENLTADAFIAIIIGLMIPYWYEKVNRPRRVEVHERDSGNETIPYAEMDDRTGRQFSAQLVLKNSGRVALNKTVYYFFLIPAHIDYTLHPLNNEDPEEKRLGRFTFIRGALHDVVYPGRNMPLPFILNGELPLRKSRRDRIYYWISTEYGIYPKGAKNIEEVNIPSLTHDELEHLGRLDITNEL